MITAEQMWNDTDEPTRVKWLLNRGFYPEWCNCGWDGLPLKIKTVVAQETLEQIRANWNRLGVSS